jgi:hypothetical protein
MSSVRLKKVTSRVMCQSYKTLSNWHDVRSSPAAVSWQIDSRSLQLLLCYMYSSRIVFIYHYTRQKKCSLYFFIKLAFIVSCVEIMVGEKIICWSIWSRKKQTNQMTIHSMILVEAMRMSNIWALAWIFVWAYLWMISQTLSLVMSSFVLASYFTARSSPIWWACEINTVHCTLHIAASLAAGFVFVLGSYWGWGVQLGQKRERV